MEDEQRATSVQYRLVADKSFGGGSHWPQTRVPLWGQVIASRLCLIGCRVGRVTLVWCTLQPLQAAFASLCAEFWSFNSAFSGASYVVMSVFWFHRGVLP